MWLQSMRELRDSFDRGSAQYPNLGCAIGRLPSATFADRLTPPSEGLDEFHPKLTEESSGETWQLWFFDSSLPFPDRGALKGNRPEGYTENPEAHRRFLALAADAEWLAQERDTPTIKRFRETGYRSVGADNWALLLFFTAWTRPEGSILRAYRETLFVKGEGTWYRAPLFRKSDIATNTAFVSILPYDPFRASSALVDLLIAERAPLPSGEMDPANSISEDKLPRDKQKATVLLLPSANASRNEWIYEQRKAGRTHQEILDELATKHCGWAIDITTRGGINKAMQAHAAENNLPKIKGKGGRPKKPKLS